MIVICIAGCLSYICFTRNHFQSISARVSDQIDWIKSNVCAQSKYPPSYLCGAGGTSSPTKKSTPVSTVIILICLVK